MNPREQAKQRISMVLNEKLRDYAPVVPRDLPEAIVSELEKLAAEQEGFRAPEPMQGQMTVDEMLAEGSPENDLDGWENEGGA